MTKTTTSFNTLVRPIEPDDLEKLQNWRNNPNVRKYCREYRFINTTEQSSWYSYYNSQRRTSDYDTELLILQANDKDSVYSEDQYKDIGVGGFTRIEWHNRKAEFTYYIGEDSYRTEDIILDSIHTLLNIGFNQWGFNKIFWPVYAHDPNISLYKTIFHQEAVLKEEYFWNGKFQDRLYLSLNKKQYDNI